MKSGKIILSCVSIATNVQEDLILGVKRNGNICTARKLYMYFLRAEGYSYERCAKESCKDHATVIYAYNRIKDLISISDKETISLIAKISELLMENSFVESSVYLCDNHNENFNATSTNYTAVKYNFFQSSRT